MMMMMMIMMMMIAKVDKTTARTDKPKVIGKISTW